MSDERLRLLERQWRAGDPEKAVPLFVGLVRAGYVVGEPQRASLMEMAKYGERSVFTGASERKPMLLGISLTDTLAASRLVAGFDRKGSTHPESLECAWFLRLSDDNEMLLRPWVPEGAPELPPVEMKWIAATGGRYGSGWGEGWGTLRVFPDLESAAESFETTPPHQPCNVAMSLTRGWRAWSPERWEEREKRNDE